MIKVQNNTATREPIPAFLQGLAPESLVDLSWTDPALGVADAAWWPEEAYWPADLGPDQVPGDETLEVDAERRVVIVRREARDMTPEEIEARRAAKAAEVRAERDRRLVESVDRISGVRFAAMSASERDSKLALRQALLDVPQQPGFPFNVVWP